MQHSQPTITGHGFAAQGEIYGKTAAQLAVGAVRLAVAGAGLTFGATDWGTRPDEAHGVFQGP